VGQARRVIEQLRAVLAEAGADLDAVVKMTVFLQRMEDAAGVQRVRNEVWPSDPPVSSTVQVARLVSEDVRIEIEAVAVLAGDTRGTATS
jgi:2-iminobutanoate/2-iminopropanoate deaminase